MAEILDENVERFNVDVASSSGNTVIGTAVPSDFNTEGIARSAEESGVFIYTDKSFSIYFCYGGTWELYGAIDSEDVDFAGGISIPWVTHATHGASTGMYFKTEETDHTLRAVPLLGALITDFIPGDADLTKDTVIFDDTEVTIGSTTLDGVGTYFRPTVDLSGKVAGETVSFTLNGEVGGAITLMNEFTQIQTTITYDSETGLSTISYILPAEYDGSQTIETNCRGGSPLGDPFTRAVAIPTSGLIWDINVSEDSRKSNGTFPSDGEATPAFVGTANAVTTTGNSIRYYSVYQWGDGGANISVTSPFLDFTNNTKMRPNGTLDWSSGEATVAYAWVNGWKNHIGFSDIRLKDETNNLSINIHTSNAVGYDAATNKYKMRVTFMLASGNKFHYISDDYVLDNTKVNTVIITAKSDGELVVKIDGTEVSMTLEGTGVVYSGIEISGHFHLGDIAIYNSVLSGRDLEQLEAYFDFKYTTLPTPTTVLDLPNGIYDTDMLETHSWVEADGITLRPEANRAYMTYLPLKTIKVGTQGYFEYTLDSGRNSIARCVVADASTWNKAHWNFDYADTIFSVYTNSNNFNTAWYDNGVSVGNLGNYQYNNSVIRFQVEWDGTWSLWNNGTKFYTSPNKITCDELVFVGTNCAGDHSKFDICAHEGEFTNYIAESTNPVTLVDAGTVDASARINGNEFTGEYWNDTTKYVSVELNKGDTIQIDSYATYNMSTNRWAIMTTGTGHSGSIHTQAGTVGAYEKWGAWLLHEDGVFLGNANTIGNKGYVDPNISATLWQRKWQLGFNDDNTVSFYCDGLLMHKTTYAFPVDTVYFVINAAFTHPGPVKINKT